MKNNTINRYCWLLAFCLAIMVGIALSQPPFTRPPITLRPITFPPVTIRPVTIRPFTTPPTTGDGGPPTPPGGPPVVPGQGVGPPLEPPRRGSPPPRSEIENQFVVVFKRDRPQLRINEIIANVQNRVEAVLNRLDAGNFRAIKVRAAQPQVLATLRADPDIEYVEPEQGYEPAVCISQSNPPTWNLRRISQRQPDLTRPYFYSSNQGSGARIYVIDTGVNVNHWEFAGRATWGTNTVDSVNNDCFNHGTHVAAIAAGTFVGVAKSASVVSVKVISCTGWATTSTIINGINWAVNHYLANRQQKGILNLSLGGPFSQAINDAVSNAVANGMFVSVSAGNVINNACNFSPSSAGVAVTVGASQLSSFGNGSFFDSFAPFSNYGSCIDVLAPGVNILSAGNRNNIDYSVMSGTSMAAPHVAGIAALLWTASPGLSPGQVASQVVSQSTVVPISFTGSRVGTPNRVAFHQCV